MPELKPGSPAPDFTLPTDNGGEFTLSEQRGKKVIIYFYPKDNTPGCTKESCGFRDNFGDFSKLNAMIIGISKDSVKSHDKFKAKHELNFPLGSDENNDVCERYGIWKEKNMYGRKFMGIVRSTFLINEDGVIEKIWRKVKVKDHMDEVREALQELSAAA